ncbi:hypothetical protein MLD38_026823 [Melastoma candidum]|uniref:Uncharacterized protein n=1 Tax=Melastoma candidum TaxID=119954 RepID=A0ACB9P1D1_9MYRT|nr:hypothetical protein MLD38_026823 [Melastoma candidum]
MIDVFLEAAKVFKYSENEVGASILFGLFAISWVVLRLIFFPFWVIRASSYYFVHHVPLAESYKTLLYYIFNMIVFHIYWWVLIYSMIMRQLSNNGKVREHTRSDSDDD